ncbi:transporter substrate-binding domain-containing protein [Salegentibacter chungangensis]|uniref:Transporter substrate-binding domain-containing protein n=1 Tax=Salegentibacter chungangensis TaxID=1335724 RepID=A0ABW3NU71_9FLAO
MKTYFNLFLLFILLFGFNNLSAQDQDSIPGGNKVVIGLTETPPFVVKEGNGKFSGLSIDSWNLVNEKLELDYTFKTYPNLAALLKAVKDSEVDFSINPITVTDQRMKYLEFSQPYFISHTGVAKRKESKTWSYIKKLWSWDFISAVLVLIGVIFIFGFLVWVFERKSNKEEFGEDARGILQGFWWSAVTMTTVGYGDKSPRTFGGRLVGLIWMFLAIIMISSLTAGIASSLTVKSMNDEINSVEDLGRFEVSTVTSSSAAELLELYNIEGAMVTDVRGGIQSLLDKKTSLFVYDEPILKYEIERRELEDEVEILQKSLKKDYYSYSFPKKSVYTEIIDPVLISTLKTLKWSNLMKDYQ